MFSTSYNKLSLWITLGNSNFKSTLNNKKFSLLSLTLCLFQPLLLMIHLKVPFTYLCYHSWWICVEPFTFLFVSLWRCLSKNWCYRKGAYNSTSAYWVSVLELPPSSSWIPEVHFDSYSKTLLFKERHPIRCHILHGHECKCSIISHTYCLGILQSVIDVRLFNNFFFQQLLSSTMSVFWGLALVALLNTLKMILKKWFMLFTHYSRNGSNSIITILRSCPIFQYPSEGIH